MGNVCMLSSRQSWHPSPMTVADPFHLRPDPHYRPPENGHILRATAKVERHSGVHIWNYSHNVAVAIDWLSD